MRSNSGCSRRSALFCGRGVSTGRGGGKRGKSRSGGGIRGRRGRLHPRPIAVPSAGLGHTLIFGLERGWRSEVGRFSSQGEVKWNGIRGRGGFI